MAQVRITAAAKTTAGTIGSIVAVHYLPALLIVAILVGAVIAGVVLPAVWSAKPARRAAALAVLQEILRTIRRIGPQPPDSIANR